MLMVLLVFIFVGCSSINVSSSSDEKTYQEVLRLLQQEKWWEARNLMDNLQNPNYKDAKVLKEYAYLQHEYSWQYAKGIIKLSDVNVENIPNDYNGILKDEILLFKRMVIAKKEAEVRTTKQAETLKQVKEEQAKINEAVKFIKTKKYAEACKLLELETGEPFEVLYHYAKAFKDKDFKYELSYIPPSYNGPLADEIDRTALKYMSPKEWEEGYQKWLDAKTNSFKPRPAIGMTAEEVRESLWGSPEDINRTTTARGVSEQWVYSGYKYVYLEDGIVTAIQD